MMCPKGSPPATDDFEVTPLPKDELQRRPESIRVDPGCFVEVDFLDADDNRAWFKQQFGIEWHRVNDVPMKELLEIRRKILATSRDAELTRKKNDPVQIKIAKLHELNFYRDKVSQAVAQLAEAQGRPESDYFTKYELTPQDFN